MNEEQSSRRAQIEGWLKRMGIVSKDIEDPMAAWHLEFFYPIGSAHPMHAFSPKQLSDAVVILSRANIGPDLLANFAALDFDVKDEFLWNLRETLLSPEVDFQMENASGPLDCPSAIQTMVTRYYAGVTLDSFARSVGAVYKTEMAAGWVIGKYLAPKTYGGDQFDFNRLRL